MMGRARQSLKFLYRMMMTVFLIRDIVIMSMGMRHGMGVSRSVMGMGKGMTVRMDVMRDQSVDHDEEGTGGHHQKGDEIHPGEFLL